MLKHKKYMVGIALSIIVVVNNIFNSNFAE